MNENNRVDACDLPIAKLVPRSGRKVDKKQRERMAASLQAVGLLQGLRLTQVWADDTGLYSVAKKHFGTWTNTLLAAGLPPTRKQWTKDRAVVEIQAWRRQGVAISSISRQDMRLTVAAIRLFGSWHEALRAAGLKPTYKQRRTANGGQEKLTRQRNRKDIFPITKKGRNRCRVKPLSNASSSAKRKNAG